MALLFAQLTHAFGLNDVCASLRRHSGPLSAVGGATPPSRNNLSHANPQRPGALAEPLFWKVLAHLQSLAPGFARGGGRRPAPRFKAPISVVDSTTIELLASCMDGASHRRRKAAAKCHLRLDLRTQLAELYRCRWQIESFFKQIKQTLQLSDFLGNSANGSPTDLPPLVPGAAASAVRWQLWSALLCYVLLRSRGALSRWASSCTRLWAVCRAALWQRRDLRTLLERYGTAGGSFRLLAQPETLWLPGLRPRAVGQPSPPPVQQHSKILNVNPSTTTLQPSKHQHRQPKNRRCGMAVIENPSCVAPDIFVQNIPAALYIPPMDAPNEFQPLMDEIFREKVLRARAALRSDVLSLEGIELFEAALSYSRAGIRADWPDASDAEVEAEVQRRVEVRRRLDEHGIYRPVP